MKNVFVFKKIRSSLLNELHRIENEVNEQFSTFKNDFDLRQPKTIEVSKSQSVIF